ncbi:hypothetical protein [Desulfosporosinus sp. FKA]|uniref:hypothetical protein n=1 Tax=Desulfosporosinus sp. FKA TaxID=1969834 RepID=UPI000B498720|nr:hypothetical protein [Desulfosporosinus sp. FKA]
MPAYLKLKRLKATINPANNDLRETVKNAQELALIEDLGIQIINLIKENNLNTRQVNALLECVQVEIKEFPLIQKICSCHSGLK